MFRIRVILILLLVGAAVYSLTPEERKRRWLDKLKEVAKAASLAILLYWIYMIGFFVWRSLHS